MDGKTQTVLPIDGIFVPVESCISQSRVKRAGFKIVTDDDVNNPGQGITRVVHEAAGETSLICVETPEELVGAVLAVHSALVTKRNDVELCHQRLCHISKSVNFPI